MVYIFIVFLKGHLAFKYLTYSKIL